MDGSDQLERGRQAYDRQAWGEAFAQLSAADAQSALEPADLERVAFAAHMLGRDEDSAEMGARAHHEYLRLGDVTRAVRAAFWLGMGLLNRGEMAQRGGWLARGRRLLDQTQMDCVEQGYLLVEMCWSSL